MVGLFIISHWDFNNGLIINIGKVSRVSLEQGKTLAQKVTFARAFTSTKYIGVVAQTDIGNRWANTQTAFTAYTITQGIVDFHCMEYANASTGCYFITIGS